LESGTHATGLAQAAIGFNGVFARHSGSMSVVDRSTLACSFLILSAQPGDLFIFKLKPDFLRVFGE